MDTTRGFTLRARITSRWIRSEAMALPPGLLTRSTMALTWGSRRSLRSSRLTRSPPTWPRRPGPSTISPSAYTTAMRLLALVRDRHAHVGLQVHLGELQVRGLAPRQGLELIQHLVGGGQRSTRCAAWASGRGQHALAVGQPLQVRRRQVAVGGHGALPVVPDVPQQGADLFPVGVAHAVQEVGLHRALVLPTRVTCTWTPYLRRAPAKNMGSADSPVTSTSPEGVHIEPGGPGAQVVFPAVPDVVVGDHRLARLGLEPQDGLPQLLQGRGPGAVALGAHVAGQVERADGMVAGRPVQSLEHALPGAVPAPRCPPTARWISPAGLGPAPNRGSWWKG